MSPITIDGFDFSLKAGRLCFRVRITRGHYWSNVHECHLTSSEDIGDEAEKKPVTKMNHMGNARYCFHAPTLIPSRSEDVFVEGSRVRADSCYEGGRNGVVSELRHHPRRWTEYLVVFDDNGEQVWIEEVRFIIINALLRVIGEAFTSQYPSILCWQC